MRTGTLNTRILQGLKSLKILHLTGHAMFLYVPKSGFFSLTCSNAGHLRPPHGKAGSQHDFHMRLSQNVVS